MKKKAALHNLGCKVNAYETEAMQELLEQLRRNLDGYEEPRPRRLGVIVASVRGTQAAVLALQGGSKQASDAIASRFVRRAEENAGRDVCEENEKAKARAVRADRTLTGRSTGGRWRGAGTGGGSLRGGELPHCVGLFEH